MPVDRVIAADTGDQLIRLYAGIEARITAEIARRLAQGIDAPGWADDKLAALAALKDWTRRLLAGLDKQTQADISTAVLAAAAEGRRAAVTDVMAAAARDKRLTALAAAAQRASDAEQILPGAGAIHVIAGHLADKLRSAATPVLRWVEDAYREVIAAGAAPDVLAGTTTRRKAAERAWNELLGQGITGFVDRSGRRWNLATYVEMATRTTVAQAAVEAHLGRLKDLGLDLVIVSDVQGECVRCRPWEGKILARTGVAGARTVQVEHATRDGIMVSVHIAGTVAEAMAAGLLHPNCRHSLSAYFPGLTTIPTDTADPAGDAARTQLRALERAVRRNKIQAASALTPEAKAAAAARVRAAQADIRQHVDETGLIRQPSREQIDLGNKRDQGASAGPVTPVKPKPPVVPKPKIEPPVPAPVPVRPASRNPAVATGTARRWWEQIPEDTGDTPIPVRDLTLHSGYVVKSGVVHRINGVAYLIEDGSAKWAGIHDPLTQLRRFQTDLPASQRGEQNAYSWLAGEYPTGAGEGFVVLASNLDKATQVWGSGTRLHHFDNITQTLLHEFGHTVSTAAGGRTGKLGDSSMWAHASHDDAATLSRRMPTDISWLPTLLHIPEPAHSAGLYDGSFQEFPAGVTAYGKTASEEDFAESIYLYLTGRIGTGTFAPGGRKTDVWFRDIWPARAAILDRLFPEVAAQRAALSARG